MVSGCVHYYLEVWVFQCDREGRLGEMSRLSNDTISERDWAFTSPPMGSVMHLPFQAKNMVWHIKVGSGGQ